MRKSPRLRRLEADFRAIAQLRSESTIFEFDARGNPPEIYRFTFHGLGVWRINQSEVSLRDEHIIIVELGAAYPRLIPNIAWQTPIFHPNISSSGVVCLGGYGTHWVPSLTLDELCVMLWDMIRYRNFDTESPYNREAALWAKTQTDFRFPIDQRSLRNQVSGEVTGQPSGSVHNVAPPPVVVQVPDDEVIVEVISETNSEKRSDIIFID